MNKLPVGSLLWRVKSYGILAATKYLFFYRKQLRSIDSDKGTALTVEEFCQHLKLPYSCLDKVSPIINSTLGKFETLETGNTSAKFKHENFALNITRLQVISILIVAFKAQTYLETGTQFGTSSHCAQLALKSLGRHIKTSCISVDVMSSSRLLSDSEITYLVFDTSVRKQLKRFVSQRRMDLNRPIVFFHDSDHSYENMTFELHFALNNLEADIIVCDDIEGNRAFFDFVEKFSLLNFIIDNPNGPRVGVVLRVEGS